MYSGQVSAPGPSADSPHDQLLRQRRYQVFAATWLSYVGFYFCRKPFYIVKGTLTQRAGLGASDLADVGAAYLTTYTVGQFLSAGVGSLLGARAMLLAGMAISVGCNLVMGGSAGYLVLLLMMGLNGLAQATGWSGNVGTMAHWTTRDERGTVMGLWATCYQVGGILANGLAALLLGWRGWRWSFWGGAVILALITLFFFRFQRNRPEDLGLPPLAAGTDEKPAGDRRTGLRALGWNFQVVVTLLLVGGFYFCVKFIRYALWSWAPYFLQLNFGLKADQSGYLSTLFDVAGFFGVLCAGVASDRLFHSKRSIVAMIMLAGMTGGCLLMFYMGARSLTVFAISLALVGFMLYGPDSLITGAGAIDLGSREGALAAAAIINGMGAVGSVVQEKVVGGLYQSSHGELGPIFFTLLSASALSMVFIGTVLWRNARGQSDL